MVANCWSPGDGFYWWGIENGVRRKWHHARSYFDNFNWCSMQIEYMFRLTLPLPVFAMSSVSLPLAFQWKILSKLAGAESEPVGSWAPTGFWWRVDKTWRQCGFAFWLRDCRWFVGRLARTKMSWHFGPNSQCSATILLLFFCGK